MAFTAWILVGFEQPRPYGLFERTIGANILVLEQKYSQSTKKAEICTPYAGLQPMGAVVQSVLVIYSADAVLPKTLALIDDDSAYAQGLSEHLRTLGVVVDVFGNSNDLLAHENVFGYDFYVVDLMLPGVDGIELIDILRRRTQASVVVVSGRLAPDVFEQVVKAGADMYLAKPVRFEQVVLAVTAVHRRAGAAGPSQNGWLLDRRAGQLIAPDGAHVELSPTDVTLLECFLEAGGEVVRRESLRQKLGLPSDPGGVDGLSGTIFRLRRRIERATPVPVPLQTKSGVGYAFGAPLNSV